MHTLGTPAAQCDCEFRPAAPDHHDRLLEIESSSFEVLRELIDLVATWGEVEFGSHEPLVEPADWLGFVEQHEWQRPDDVLEIMLSLWSITLPHSPGAQPPTTLASPCRAGSVTSIDQAPSMRCAGRTA
ncbi:MAG: hypothetical protein ACLGHQ_06030 [Acidimicrobiia bacterium]